MYDQFINLMLERTINEKEIKWLFLGESHKYGRHSDLELNYPLFNGLSINQICAILDSLDLYTICKIIDDNLKVKKYINRNQELINMLLTGIDSYGNYFDVLPVDINEDKITYNKKIINKINAYEMLYGKIRLPIGTILSSINTVNTSFDTDAKTNLELVGKIFEYQESCPEKILTKKK